MLYGSEPQMIQKVKNEGFKAIVYHAGVGHHGFLTYKMTRKSNQ
jgi:hypothetical protein